MGLRFMCAALTMAPIAAVPIAAWIALADLAAAEEASTDAKSQRASETDRPFYRPLDPAAPLEPQSSLATKKEVEEAVRELLRQTDELDEESEDELQDDAPSPPRPELSR